MEEVKESAGLTYWENEIRKAKDIEKFEWNSLSGRGYSKGAYSALINTKNGTILNEICKGNNFLMYAFLVSAIKIGVAKYTAQKNTIIGIPSYRTEEKRGSLNKVLPLVSYLDYESTYLEYMKFIKNKILTIYKTQDYLNSKILVENNFSNDVMELTTVTIAMKKLHQDKDIEYICNSSKNELSFLLELMEDNSIKVDIVYNANKVLPLIIESLCKCCLMVLNEVLNNHNKKIMDIKMFSQEEENKVIYEFNDTKKEYPKHKTIHELFELQVDRTPNNIAVAFENIELTYMELNEKSNKLARTLRYKGIKPNSIVGIMVDSSVELIIGILAILKAGGAYLPIDSNYPNERIEYILKDSGCEFLLSSEKLISSIDFTGEVLDLFNKNLASECSSNLENITKSSDLVYVIYTSGTTGNAKGVMVKHYGLVNYCTSIIEKASLTWKDETALLSSYAFDLGYTTLFTSLIAGIKLYIVPEEKYKDPNELVRLLKKGITYIKITPSLFNMITSLNDEDIVFKDSKLRLIILGGESINTKDINRFISLNGKDKIEIMNHYGPTETTIGCVSTLINLDEVDKFNNIIGKPLNNIRAYIIDKYDNILGIGMQGELCIGGDCLAEGYLNRPELNKEKFVESKYLLGELVYKTGDLARWLPNGNIEFRGRIDNQVKIRGFRIELGEIENRLLMNSHIKEAFVIVRENKDKENYICAYVVSDKNINSLNLKNYLKKSLPNYMIPTYFVQLNNIPIIGNGKVDKRALPEPNLNDNLNEYVAPRTKIEEVLANIWSEILSLDKVGINDNFFEIGGHSLKATVLISRIHKELNREIPLKELFKSPTIKALSEFIENNKEKTYLQINKVKEKSYYETSSAQKRMYMLQQFDKTTTAYNMPEVFELIGNIHKDKIEEIFKLVVARHEALRTYFETVDGEIVQRIAKEDCFRIENKKCDEDIELSISSFIRPFNLKEFPLFRVEILENNDKTYLLIDIHHIISDGISRSILIKEFIALYNGEKLSSSNLQYKDFVEWQNNLLSSEEIKKQEEYWLNRFNDEIPVLNLPYDYERPAMQTFEGDNLEFTIDEKVTTQLKKLAKETETTIHMILLSAFNILLSKYSGQDDIVVGIPVAGRVHADLQNIMGLFVNTLALRNKPKGDKIYIDFLKEVKENSIKAYENQSYQLEALVEKLNVVRDMSRNPLFDVMFNMGDVGISDEFKLGKGLLKKHDTLNKISKVDLTLNAVEENKSLKFNISYCSRIFNKETIKRLSNHYVRTLYKIIDNDYIRLGEIELLTENERYQMVDEYNNTDIYYINNNILKDLVEKQVEKTPKNIAVIFKNKKMTYKELNDRSNQLARRLKEKGVGPNSMVGVMIERSLDMIVSIVGVLKAGGAYLPIEPSYPEDRIRFILENSNSNILITQSKYKNISNLEFQIIDIEDKSIYLLDNNNLQTINSPKDLAYTIYTSGSTGNPKGVMITHEAVANTIEDINSKFNVNEKDKIIGLSSICFDLSVYDIFGALSTGATLVQISDQRDVKEIIDVIKNQQITIWNSVPAIMDMLLENVMEEFSNKSLRLVLLSGDWISLKLPEKIKAVFSEAKIISLGGATEASIWSIYYPIEEVKKEWSSIPYGMPLANQKFYILDKEKYLATYGVPGELYIGGLGLAKGYMNDLEKTKNSFIIHDEFGLLYRTGDWGRFHKDGYIEFLGRKDHQIKIRGFRVELGEIENRLLQHEYIKEVAIVVKESKVNKKYICAYIVSDKDIKKMNFKTYLNESLPDYMIPSYFIQLDRMPLTPNGKIDRRSFPDPNSDDTLHEYEAPRDQVEEMLEKIWGDVLGIQKIGINNNFFELGGNSIDAIKVISKINNKFNVLLEIREFYAEPTISSLGIKILQLINGVSLEEVNIELSEKFGEHCKLVKYETQEFNEIVLYVEENYEEVLEYIKNKFNVFIYPDYVLPYNKLECEECIQSINIDVLYEKIEAGKIENEDMDSLLKKTNLYIDAVDEAISNEKVVCKYEIGDLLNRDCKARHFLNKRKIMNIIVPFENNISENNVKDIFIKLVNEQDVLRTVACLEEGYYKFAEYDHIKDIDLNILNLARYDYKSKINIVTNIFGLMRNSLLKSNFLNNILYKCVIVKLSAKKYCLLLVIDHMISDIDTTRIIKRYFNKGLGEISKTLPYRDFISKYLVKNKEKELIEFSQSKLLNKFINETVIFNNKHPEYLASEKYEINYSEPFILNYSLNSENLDDKDSNFALQMAIYITSNILAIQFGLDRIPIRILVSKHILKEGNYYFTIGNLNDMIPCTIDADFSNSNKYYKRYLKSYEEMNDYNLYLNSLTIMPEWFKVLYTDSPFSLNYLGEYDSIDDESLKPLLKNRLSYPYPVQAYSVNSSILRLAFLNGINNEKIHEVKNFLDSLEGQCSYFID